MILGIMQPYFFPYLGYFELIARSDRWVVFDSAQYTPKTWMNRNRILHPTDGWQYLTVPVRHPVSDRRMQAIRIANTEKAAERILGQLRHYRKARAPHFSAVYALVESAFTGLESSYLVELNVRGLRLVCDYLCIPFAPLILSQSGIVLPPITQPGDWALEVSAALGATEYINPPNGRDLFDEAAFARRNIRLSITDLIDYRYACGPYAFVERLSVIDVLMWNEPADVRDYLTRRIASA